MWYAVQAKWVIVCPCDITHLFERGCIDVGTEIQTDFVKVGW